MDKKSAFTDIFRILLIASKKYSKKLKIMNQLWTEVYKSESNYGIMLTKNQEKKERIEENELQEP